MYCLYMYLHVYIRGVAIRNVLRFSSHDTHHDISRDQFITIFLKGYELEKNLNINKPFISIKWYLFI